jgi:hypothetical protein
MSTLRALLKKIKEHKAFLPKTLTPEDLKRSGDNSIQWVSFVPLGKGERGERQRGKGRREGGREGGREE